MPTIRRRATRSRKESGAIPRVREGEGRSEEERERDRVRTKRDGNQEASTLVNSHRCDPRHVLASSFPRHRELLGATATRDQQRLS